ncbi:MAG: alpha/beta hydrolase [Muribaculaceae bacterium]|nr:alpha/beta hydrolase [Muribaculaceae bacterium]
MKRIISILLNILVGVVLAYSQSGIWSGDLEVQGNKLPIVFHLDDDKPVMDSPSQGVKGIPIQITREAPVGITINIPVIGASFKGVSVGDKILGKFTQSGMTFPLTLIPGEKLTIRPQTPKPPYPYSLEEVSFTNGDAVLKGTLTLPEGVSKDTPVVIMVTGSGLQNRDEEIFDHKPFAVIADALARNGIASLRYDDRGFGESTGDAVNCTTEDLMKDALAGIDLLRKRFNKVGVLGHSEGGTIAFMLGADNKVDFIVSLAGMIVSGKETLLDQNRYALSKAGYPKQVVDEYCGLLTLAFDGDDSIIKKLDASNLPTELKQNIQVGLGQLKTPYMQYFLGLDLRDRLGKVACPVLALNGTKDTQVSYDNNLGALNKGLPSNSSNKIMSLDSLNHLFQHCETGSSIEYATIEETISHEVLDIITQWIKSLKDIYNYQLNFRKL